jgi:hypothetical protein
MQIIKKIVAYILDDAIRLDNKTEFNNKPGVVIWQTLDEPILGILLKHYKYNFIC